MAVVVALALGFVIGLARGYLLGVFFRPDRTRDLVPGEELGARARAARGRDAET